MALIACSECGKDVSDKAAACPHCGNPIATAAATRATGEPTVITTQETAKRFKGHQLAGGAVFCLGFVMAIAGDGGSKQLGALVAVLGLGWYLVARFNAWWHHG